LNIDLTGKSNLPQLSGARGASACALNRKISKRPNAETRCSPGHEGLCLVDPGSAGNVQMGPGSLTGKRLQKQGRGNSSGAPTTIIPDVCYWTANLLGVSIIQRHLPDPLTAHFSSSNQVIHQLLVRSHDARSDLAKRDHASAGQGGGINNRGGAALGRIGYGIREDQSAFSVSVDDLYGLASQAPDHIAGFIAPA